MSDLSFEYTVRRAQITDLEHLAAIEQSAAFLFLETNYPFLAEFELLSSDFIKQQFDKGMIWTAADFNDEPIGFVVADDVDGTMYICEIDVNPSYGRRGIGRALIKAVCDWAKQEKYKTVSLSTMIDVPWNAPFYAKLGFQTVDNEDLSSGFRKLREKEDAAGLPLAKRVIMFKEL